MSTIRNDNAGLTLVHTNGDTPHPRGRGSAKRKLIARFRAYHQSTAGPDRSGDFKLTLGTNAEFKDAMWALTNHPGEYFEVEIRTVHPLLEE